MSGNFIKGGFVKVVSNDKVVIDNNEAIKKRLEEYKIKNNTNDTETESETEEGFKEGLDLTQIARLVSDEEQLEGQNDTSSSFSEGLPFANSSGGNSVSPISEANAKYDEIIDEANKKAEEIYENAKNEGLEAGYQEGYNKAANEARLALEKEYSAKAEALNSEIALKEIALKNEYEQQLNDIEPMLVDKICDLIKHIIKIDLSDKRELIINILRSSLSNMDSGKHYLIHVSAQDYETVKDSKSEIALGTGLLEDSFDIIQDNSVAKNGALIESEAGIFDCGLDTRLELLKKQLMLISFE